MSSNRPLLLLKRQRPLIKCPQCQQQSRTLHRLNAPPLRTPKPTPFVPDVPTFLTLIGRNLSSHASKIPSWNALFTLTSAQLKESGIEPARARRYLLWWRDRFRNGITGIGGGLEHVKDGKAELRIVEVPSDRAGDRWGTLTKSAGMRKVVVNVEPSGVLEEKKGPPKEGEERPDDQTDAGQVALMRNASPAPRMSVEEARPVEGMKIHQGTIIGGTWVQGVKGHQGVAVLKVQEGLWEQRRGHKVDGGERRKAEVRAKRRVQERKNAK